MTPAEERFRIAYALSGHPVEHDWTPEEREEANRFLPGMWPYVLTTAIGSMAARALGNPELNELLGPALDELLAENPVLAAELEALPRGPKAP